MSRLFLLLIPDPFIITLTFAIHGLISLIGAKGKHFSWVVFLAISGLVFVAAN